MHFAFAVAQSLVAVALESHQEPSGYLAGDVILTGARKTP